MDAPLSLSNVLTVFVAALCVWTIMPQSRGGIVKLWQLAIPACLAAAEALVLLAGVFDANLANDAEWLAALIVGGVIGRMRGWALDAQVDQMRRLVRLQPALDGLIAAIALVALAAIDLISAALLDPVVAHEHVAAGAALFAGFIGARAIAIATRATRAPHVELHSA
jgi:hypothetical protein